MGKVKDTASSKVKYDSQMIQFALSRQLRLFLNDTCQSRQSERLPTKCHYQR